MAKYLGNAFSLQMVDPDQWSKIRIERIEGALSQQELESCISAIGHADTAAVLGVSANRISVHLEAGDELFVAQLMGGRLPEGSTTLPEGFSFLFARVTLAD